ncbi:Olfactomedin-4 [Anabarilius grahami]|uniref:Olfactomedin-4 n=1 Tax=Anabarilius grahami TaxID=495550 RepID=A0A3N0Z8D4_ANAGA|nr:Olfactomedin-4 [Anabarilius grahami]
MSQSNAFILMIIIHLSFSQSVRGKECVCDLKNVDPPFPENELTEVETTALQCIKTITLEKMNELDRLVLGLQQRIKQLEDNVIMLEKEDNRNIYGAVSLRIIELEISEIQDLVDKLNRTTKNYQHLSVQTADQLEAMKDSMVKLEKFDKMQTIKKYREIQIKKNLEECKKELKATAPPPTVSSGRCGLGRMVSVSGPRMYSLTVYGTSYPYGAWGKDAKPAPGDEKKYWLVVLSRSNVYGHFIRQLQQQVSIRTPRHHIQLYGYGFATDDSGVYVIYASTSNFGNVIISKVETSNPPVLSQTWSTSLHKKTVTNTFMVCGVLYATRYLDKEIEEIFYSYDTKTNKERYDLRIHIKKMQTNIEFLNYDPRDHLLYVYSDAYILTYELIFQ